MMAVSFEAWLTLLDKHDVKFVLVGGFAGVLHGAQRPTLDLDVVPAWTQINLMNLVTALKSVHAASRSGPLTTSDELTVQLLVEREVTNWRTDIGPIDVLVGIPDHDGLPVTFDRLRVHAETIIAFERAISVASLEDIIASKEFANRRKDSEALPELRRLRDEQA
ncbi:hypothetical protein IMCC26256_112313 [Actinobacteria bacterium IMCC26256]|nr:hypothetical protein IMCC26256_112313 [Actinobacteria bacterium IMCC26256]